MVGDGKLRKEIEWYIGCLELKDDFILLGFRDDVEEIIPCFEVFVLTSLWEGLPRVFLQAMAAKVPIVANDVDGTSEAVKHGKTGYLVMPKDMQMMAEYVMFLLQNENWAKEMGIEGYKKVEKFSINKMLDDIDELYRG